eukprot:TRINITY_DN2465_c0_g1_i3.p1 TRINITY_DN2465_c0_g1~~TRINITY_DN2465_c0_g1_i3.p1  ORF type:complete len:335 (-),score=40.01 TRINITY_DN2465_c0_g1_i3:398-1402(-)
MGKISRCNHEKVMQKMVPNVMSTKSFQPTSNARNEAMFNEAKQFKQWVQASIKDTHTLQTTIQKFVDNTFSFMNSSLPRVMESDDGFSGNAQPVGSGVNMEQLYGVPEEINYFMDIKVVQPLQLWISKFQGVSVQMKDLEDLRLVVDSRRRTVDSLNMQLAKLRNKQSQKQIEDPKLEEKINNMDLKCKHKESKSTETMERYRQMENEVNKQMTELVKDSEQVSQYMGLAMFTVSDGFNTAYAAFSGRLVPSKLPDSYHKKEKSAQKQSATGLWGSISKSFYRKKTSEEQQIESIQGVSEAMHNGTKMSRYDQDFEHGQEDPDEIPNTQPIAVG